MAREFSKVSPALWGSRRFAELTSDDARFAYLYLLTNAHQTSAGAYRMLPGYACVDLGGWPLERFSAAMSALEAADMIAADPETSEVLITRWFKHCPPMNEKHFTGTVRLIGQLKSDKLRTAAAASLNEAWDEIQARKATAPVRASSSHLLHTPRLRAHG